MSMVSKDEYDLIFKVPCVGYDDAGMSTFLLSSDLGQFVASFESLIGGIKLFNTDKKLIGHVGPFYPGKLINLDDQRVYINTWSLGEGYSHFKRLLATVLKYSTMITFFYDISETESLQKLKPIIDFTLGSINSSNFPIGLVGCKSDLGVNVSQQSIDELLTRYNSIFSMTISSKKMEGMDALWTKIGNYCLTTDHRNIPIEDR